MKPATVTAEFRRWLGVPWVHQGRTEHGVDCGGLIVMALRKLELLPAGFLDPQAYTRAPQPSLAKLIEQHCRWVEDAGEGRLILVRWSPSQDPSHLGYCSGRNLIHSYSRMVGRGPSGPKQAGRVIEHRYGEPWVRQTVGVYEIPGIEYP